MSRILYADLVRVTVNANYTIFAICAVSWERLIMMLHVNKQVESLVIRQSVLPIRTEEVTSNTANQCCQ